MEDFMDNFEISVVITVYRAVDLLPKAIESVLQQTFDDFEIVLVNNNGSDETINIAKIFERQYPERIRIVHEPTQGVCSARNRGILASRGKYIAILDEDDIMFPDRLERQYDVIKRCPELSLITCHSDLLSYDGSAVIKKNIPITGEWGDLFREDLLSLMEGHLEHNQLDSFYLSMPSTFFFLRETAIRAGLFNPRMNPQYCEDDEFLIRMFEKGGFHTIPQSLIFFRSAQRVDKYSILFRLTQSFRLLEILWERYGPSGHKETQVLRKIHSRLLNRYGFELLRCQFGASFGRAFLRKAFYCKPDIKSGKLFLKTFFPETYLKRLFWIDPSHLNSQEKFDHSVLRAVLAWSPEFNENKLNV
jgi:glycosyltransferase involved in cell wall biosynthesis